MESKNVLENTSYLAGPFVCFSKLFFFRGKKYKKKKINNKNLKGHLYKNYIKLTKIRNH